MLLSVIENSKHNCKVKKPHSSPTTGLEWATREDHPSPYISRQKFEKKGVRGRNRGTKAKKTFLISG